MKESLVECSFLLPIVRDSDQQPHAPIVWRQLVEALHRTFGGRTGPRKVFVFWSAELIPGGWVPEGSSDPIEDESRMYRVAVSTGHIEELRTILRKAAKSFDQRAIYLSVAGAVEFVEPQPDDGFLE